MTSKNDGNLLSLSSYVPRLLQGCTARQRLAAESFPSVPRAFTWVFLAQPTTYLMKIRLIYLAFKTSTLLLSFVKNG